MTAVLPDNKIFRRILDFGRPVVYEFVLHNLFAILLKDSYTLFTQFNTVVLHYFLGFCYPVPPVGLSAWRSFVFRSSITMIFRPDFTVIHTSLECTWYLYIIVFYALIIYLPYHCSIRFLFSLRAGGFRAGGFFVPDGTVGCHYDDLWCRWWRRGCGLDDHLFSVLD